MFTGFLLVNFETFLLNSKTSSLKSSPASVDNDHSTLPSTKIADRLP